MQKLNKTLIVLSLLAAGSCKTIEKSELGAINASSGQGTQTTLIESDDVTLEQIVQGGYLPPSERSPATSSPLLLPADYQAGEPFSVIKEPRILQELEQRGFALSQLLGHEGSAPKNAQLYASNSLYKSAADILTADLQEMKQVEKKNSICETVKCSTRLFDARWFQSPYARYELIGVVNRIDRTSFETSSCGELRFVYRLAYEKPINGKPLYSRLPMTLMMKYLVTHDPSKTWIQEKNEYAATIESMTASARIAHDKTSWRSCYRYVDNWVYPAGMQEGSQFVDWAVSNTGPLGTEIFNKANFNSMEVNLQGFRMPSTVRPQLGGHASYIMRVFHKKDNALVPTYLENTPDVAKIQKNPELRNELIKSLNNPKVLNALDAGILRLPEKFLAQKAISYSPYGISRRENRLFHQILSESDIKAKFNPTNSRVINADAALRRLNDMSCVGCHQGRATAGFHFLGIDRLESHSFNSLVFEGSGHFSTELKRRKAYMKRIQNRLYPSPYRDFSIAPPSEWDENGRAHYEKAGYGHYCGLPGVATFAKWQCAEGLQCVQTDEAKGEKALGKCMPTILRAGDPCVQSFISQDNRDKDSLDQGPNSQRTCGAPGDSGYACQPPKGGFPSGMCTLKECDKIKEGEICGHFAGTGFSNCIASVNKNGTTFQTCLSNFSQEGGRGLCNEDKACRNDYVCGRTWKYDERNRYGACAPSYFLFQVRLDAHPSPVD